MFEFAVTRYNNSPITVFKVWLCDYLFIRWDVGVRGGVGG